MKTKTCGRCKGKGRVKCGVLHLGIPGLCYECDGKGVLRFLDAATVAAKKLDGFASHQAELAEKAEYVKTRMEKTRSVVLKARYEAELADLRSAWKAVAVATKGLVRTKGEWVA